MIPLVPQKLRLAPVLDTNIVLDLLHFRDPSVEPIMRTLRDLAPKKFRLSGFRILTPTDAAALLSWNA
jgi:hypothetical protein